MLIHNPIFTGSISLNGTDISQVSTVSTDSSSFASRITNNESTSSAYVTTSGSFSNRITNTESTASVFITASGSFSTRTTAVEATASQYVTASGSLAARLTSNEAKTGSFATTGSNFFIGNQVITGSVYIANDLIVQGSSSLQNITASAVSVGTNTIILNTATPILQFGGISVFDSGSTMGRSGSLLWNSINDHWINVNPSGSDEGYNSAMVINGPKNTGSLGNEAGLTTNYIPVSQGEDHITDSIIFQSGSVNIGIGTTTPSFKLDVSGNGRFKVSTDRNLAIRYDENITLSAQSDAASPENLRIYADTFRIYTSTTAVGLTERFSISNTGAATFTGALSGSSATFSGNLGLGSTSSAYKLRILTDNTLDNGLYLSGGTGNTNHAVYIENKAGTAELFAVRGDGQIRLNGIGSGNILIGTSIAGGEVLTVYRASGGGVEFQNSTTGTGAGNGTYVGNYQGDAYFWNYENYASILGTNNTERMRITSGGNVVVGTSTDAGYRLSVSNNGNNTYLGVTNQTGGTGDRYIRIGFGSGHTYATIQGTRLSVADDVNLILQPGGANVGIGTTSPASRLHIENTTGSDLLRLSSTSVNTRYVYTITGGATDPFTLRRNHINDGNLDIMTWDYNGRVGIGTTDPGGWKFRVISSADGAQITSGASTQTLNLLNASANPTILRINNNNGNFYDIQNNYSNNNLTFDYNDTTRMTIQSDGGVVIGRALGNQYSQTSSTGTTSIVDTGITYNIGDYGGFNLGATYQVVFNGNPNAGGSGYYFAQYMGILMIYTGWSGSAVTTYINYTQLATGNNISTLTLTPKFWNGSSEVSSIGVYTSGYQIRLKIDGYNSSYVGSQQSVYLTRLS